MHVEPFSVHLDEDDLSDLRARIRDTRWPDQAPAADWGPGTNLEYLRRLLGYWADRFDWRKQERWLNTFDHFRAELDGCAIHFVHARAAGEEGIPLILTHGWPSTFVEFLPLVPLLTRPGDHGVSGPAFDLVIPSLPGYGFSERPARTAVTSRDTARLWHGLMRGLGYERYGAHGGDFGAAVSAFMALHDPDPMLGIHLSGLELQPFTGQGSKPLSAAERAYLERSAAWWEREGGYKAIQSTRPLTLGYGLNDSPAGLAAWILEKWRSWADCGGDLERRFSREFLLTTLTIYWATRTITSSMWYYFDNRWHGGVEAGPGDYVRTPTAVALFADPAGLPPREWAERLFDVRRWTHMPRGGHFAPVEEPELLARDIAAFFDEV
ncbi:MAG: alpha/beta fold hydrolase [Gemmatimonadetes bacterium]|uniref:Epoxide hydrolase 1 n=1 Tax=Candidatus Kutchimonas denitrificans TaxID=3056748 RepID=A0AAE5CDH0_9BACT|nr:epoxide hydrolase 1 [Gemmatimonadota bacterium]NIR75764.1 epoxide hydrolase 1 [Candidatus Kutchimonas denitrificans]NIT68789.1 epoxide hydrolase 1 [Gemmatimonadota bacterium]NIW77514.1 alpha/beta fold hydrolase [Gemmatimonadota bacterium]NIY37366.1 alpha/beta fold hydrolase [Gemmatimonadota bacterium]